MLKTLWFWFSIPFKIGACMAAFCAGCFVIGWSFDFLMKNMKKEG